MHEGELPLDDGVAARLIAREFPELRELPRNRVRSTGTVNTIIRVGDELVARFALLGATAAELTAEAAAMAEMAAACPFPAPRPIGVGSASEEFPSAWSLHTWLDGETAHHDRHAGSESLARDLATLVDSLREVPVRGRIFDGRGRGGDLADHDEWMTECFARSGRLLDVPTATALWTRLRALPRAGADVMSDRDLTPFNLLVTECDGESRLTGVLDSGSFGPADPALDLVAAWHLLDAPARQTLRAAVGADDLEWRRGAAWAFQQAMGLGWYYETSNPPMAALGLSTMHRLLADEELAALTG
ncbi:phosphotransferase [Microbacterium sp. EST19A]|uniref:phosphotransferase n=1 Tax=Microbacterium sp. EST19A TaxID=2862681 RepID=UPI001CC0CD9C|nr:phosphotransferase [Microbacterium sp. EST19A]